MRKATARRIVKLLLYLFARSRRPPKVPQAYAVLPRNIHEFEREPNAGELASTAAAIAAIGLKRRQAGTRR